MLLFDQEVKNEKIRELSDNRKIYGFGTDLAAAIRDNNFEHYS